MRQAAVIAISRALGGSPTTVRTRPFAIASNSTRCKSILTSQPVLSSVPPDQLGEVTVERLARRIRFALLALQEGSTIDLTNGHRA
jgi:hypothetical protein